MSIKPEAKPKPAPAGGPPPAKPKPAPAKPKSDVSPKKDEQPDSKSPEGEEEFEEPVGSGSFFRSISSFLVSLIVHVILLLILALWSISDSVDRNNIALNTIPQEEEEFVEEDEIFELDEEIELEDVELQDFTPQSLDPMGMADFGAQISDELVDASLDSVSSYDTAGNLFGESGDGMATLGDGSGGAQFFGVKSPGKKFIFVVDNSLSMTKGRFEMACMELFRTVSYFSSSQKFYVIFFSDTAYPLFYPQTEEDFAPATSENKYKLRAWLEGVHLVLRTDAQSSVQKALEMKPNAIYILTDGAFTDNTYQYLMKLEDNKIPIHTVGMEIKPEIAAKLKQISEKHNGNYRDVTVPVQIRDAAKRRWDKSNMHRSNGPVWGIALGKGKPKKPGGGGNKKPGGGGGNKKK